MLNLPPSVRLFVATQAIDGRKGVDSLTAMIRSVFEHDIFGGHLYVFFSRRRDRVRIVYWDRDGFAMWMKRLERGRYQAPLSADGRLSLAALEHGDLALILEGIDVRNAKRRPRWTPTREDELRPT